MAGAAALYTLAAVAHLLYIFKREVDGPARWSTRAAWAIHTVGLVLLVLETGHAPVATLFEFAYFLSWLVMAPYVILELLRGNQAAGAFVVPSVALVQVAAAALPKPSAEHVVERFPVSLIGWHIGVIMLGYGFFVAAFVAGALYLIQERNLRRKRYGPMYYRLPSLESLDIWGARFVYLGYPLLTFGVAAGLLFAQVTWSAFWHADPKVVFTVLVWFVYTGYLATRNVWSWGGRRSAWWSVAGVAAILVNYFVITLFSRLHRFGV